MAITKNTIFDSINIRNTGHFEVRMANVYTEDGVEVGTKYSRRVITPGDDVTNEPQKIKSLAQLIWTQAMIDAVNAAKAAAKGI